MRKTSKILWFVYDFYEPGGGERWILEGERVFQRNGVKTQIVCKNFNEKVYFNGKYETPVVILYDKRINTKSLFSKIVGFLVLIKNLRRLIRSGGYQSVLCQGFREMVIVFFATLGTSVSYAVIDFGQVYHFKGIKIKYSRYYKDKIVKFNSIIESYGEKPDNFDPPRSIMKRIESEIKGALIYFAYKKSKNIFTLSERVKREDKELYNKESYVIKCAYNESIFDGRTMFSNMSKENRSMILTVGRLIPNKRVDLCLRAVDILRRTNKNFIFYIGGTGPEMEKLQNLAKDLCIEDYVKFLGFIKESELIDYYLSCELFTTMDHCDFDITSYMALALGKKVVWPKLMEVDSNLSGNRHIFPTLPEPEQIAKSFEKALNSNIGVNNIAEEDALRNYTYEVCFLKMLKQFDFII